MPATRERVFICPDRSGQPSWIVDLPLWSDRDKFFKQFGERQFETGNPVYVDYALLLAGWEALAWDLRCKERFAQDPRSQEPFFLETMQRLEAMLKAASWVIVETYEWESGLS